jgi:predicted ester cyclase
MRSKYITCSVLAVAMALPSSISAAPKSKHASSGAPTLSHSTVQKRNLANFDDLDFRVFSGQRWDELSKSHAHDIVVHYPDGSTTTGIPAHIEKLKPQFAFAPDSAIREHPIRLADGNYTSVQGVMTGTFSKPMVFGTSTIQPTGKKFRLSMVTIGRWEKGLMKEEWLYWDNAAFMSQIGTGK